MRRKGRSDVTVGFDEVGDGITGEETLIGGFREGVIGTTL